ncbi:MAG: hypothetical protein KAG64_01400 [Bacteroidales bacterium]|nr:hypothetical protein [Bacteroidales bacterium]
MRITAIILVFFMFSISASANFDFNQNCRKAYDKMMVFDFESASIILDKEKKLHPNNLVPDYISTYILFWKAALNEEEEDMEVYEDKVDNLIEDIEDDDEKSAYKNYMLSDIYLRGAYIKGMQTSYMSAAYRFNKAYNLIQKNRKDFPNFIPNKKLIGLLNVGIGTVPKKYTWVLNLFNFEGNIMEGLKELKSLLYISANDNNYHYLLSESLLLYSFTMVNFEVSKESQNELLGIYKWDIIKNELPTNPFMIFAKASFLKHIKKTDDAIRCIQNKNGSSTSMHFYYLDYMLGECMLNKLDFTAAIHFQKYVNEYNGNSFRRSACQKLAWTYLLQGKNQQYQTTIKKCLSFGNDNRDSDRQATKEAESGKVPNINLLKARLLFDGGYYQKASIAIENKAQYNNTRDQLEHTYRLGRIYDEWGKLTKAIYYYKACIEAGQEMEYYFAANAALHLGYIYEKQGLKTKAKYLYERCLDMDFDEYQDGITQKAKAALERLEN